MPFDIGGAIGIGSSIASAFGASQANKETSKSIDKQLDFQERMYHNRYFYQMKDMERAGLNPILAYKQAPPGGPTGASYTAQNTMQHAAEIGAKTASTAVQRQAVENEQRRTDEQISQIRATTGNINADTGVKVAQKSAINTEILLKNAQTVLAAAHASESSARTRKISDERAILQLQKLISEEQVKIARAGGTAAVSEEELLATAFGKWLRWLDVTGRALNPFASAAKKLE